MKINYDKKVDAMYIYLKKDKIATTCAMATNLFADLDKKGNVVGLEILDFSKYGQKNKDPEIMIGDKSFALSATTSK